MTKEAEKKEKNKAPDMSKLWAAFAYLIFFIPLVFGQSKSAFVRFHVRQGLGILITFFVTHLTSLFLHALIGFLGAFWSILLSLADLALLGFIIFGIYNALKGRERKLPFIGDLADKLLKL